MRSVSTTVTLLEATNDTRALIKVAQASVGTHLARGARRPAMALQQAGLVTTDLMALDMASQALIVQLDRERSAPRIVALGACDARFGQGAVVPSARG